MSRFILLLTVILNVSKANGQSICNTNTLSWKDQVLLQEFCVKFKEAVDTKDPQKLSTFFNFPFTCDFCKTDSTERSNKPYVRVTKKLFTSSKYKHFLTEYLVEKVNSEDLYQNLQVADAEQMGRCAFYISFPILKPFKGREGVQGFLTVENIKGRYKISSAWAIP